MKQSMNCSTKSIKTGFYLVMGNKGFFYESDLVNITDNITRYFINALCDFKKVDDRIRQISLSNETTLHEIKRRIVRATLEHRDTGKITYWSIKGADFSECFPEEDFKRDIVLV